MAVSSQESSSLVLTDAACNKIKQLLAEEDNHGLHLRVYVTGGGCSGFQYGFRFDENVLPDDMHIERLGVGLLVDALSIQYLMGSTVDYTEGLDGARFVLNNPNATSSCGCGASFSM